MKKPAFLQIVSTAIQLLFNGRYALTFDQLKFQQKNIGFKKRINHIIQGGQLVTRARYPTCIPPILQLEPSNVCNLHCLTCATGAKMMTRPAEQMSYDLFCHIIDQVKDYIHLLVFWSWGEPFINKEATAMIRYAKDQGLLVHTSTNGHFFLTRESARHVVDSGLDSLIFAVDGLDQITYQRYRKGGSLQSVLASIENVLAERSSAGVNHPRVTLRFIVMRHNEHQVDKVREFARQLGVDNVSFRSANVNRAKVNMEAELTPDTEKYQQFIYDRKPLGKLLFRQEQCYCHRPYANLTIFSSGEVVSCENDFNASISFGNAATQSISDIFFSPRFRAFYKKFPENLDTFRFCKECEIHGMKHQTHNIQTQKL